MWESSIQEGICISGAATEHADWHHEMDVETWQKILFACELDTFEGLGKYVQAWCGKDRLAELIGPFEMCDLVVRQIDAHE